MDTVTWTCSSTGWFSCSGGSAGQTNTYNYGYIINSTTLRYISTTGYETSKVNATGHHTYLLVDPSELVQGGTVSIRWYVPSEGNTTITEIDAPWMVSGSVTEALNGSSLKLWNVTYTGSHEGEFDYNTGQPNIYRYSVGPETYAYLYESTYGIVAGWSIVGTYTAFEHCLTGCSGGWTENYVGNALLTSSNINFGS